MLVKTQVASWQLRYYLQITFPYFLPSDSLIDIICFYHETKSVSWRETVSKYKS